MPLPADIERVSRLGLQIACIDFDGTLVEFNQRDWAKFRYGEPMQGARSACLELWMIGPFGMTGMGADSRGDRAPVEAEAVAYGVTSPPAPDCPASKQGGAQ